MPSIPYEVRLKMIRKEVRQAGPEAQRIFKQAFDGKPENLEFAAMCALRTPSGARYSDRAMDAGIHSLMGKIHPKNRKKIFEQAQKAGINTAGKVYNGSLGKPNNPLAWVTCADDVRKSAKIQNLTMDGALKHVGYMPDPVAPKGKKLAADLVDEFETRYTSADPKLKSKIKKSAKARRELREQIVEKHGR